MITIIEGADGTGKTTLAKSAAFADLQYCHCGPPGEDPFFEYFQLAKTRNKALFDRFHIGERVYGKLFRNDDRLGWLKQRMLERYLLSKRAVMIVAEPEYDKALHNWRARASEGKEMINSEHTYRDTFRLFRDLRRCSALPVVLHNYIAHTPEVTRARVEAARPPVNNGPGIGMFAPGVTLMVGEMCNVGRFNEPFIADTGCSPWLAQQLENAGIPETKLYWINALTPKGDVTNPEFISLLNPKHVIALGSTAIDWCRFAAGDDFIKVPHPQFWKRFKHDQRYPLLDVLR